MHIARRGAGDPRVMHFRLHQFQDWAGRVPPIGRHQSRDAAGSATGAVALELPMGRGGPHMPPSCINEGTLARSRRICISWRKPLVNALLTTGDMVPTGT